MFLFPLQVQERVAFGKLLAEQGTILSDIAQSRIEIEHARLLTLKAAHKMDTVGNKVTLYTVIGTCVYPLECCRSVTFVLCFQGAREDIAIIKIVAPLMAQRVVDRAIQVRVYVVLKIHVRKIVCVFAGSWSHGTIW